MKKSHGTLDGFLDHGCTIKGDVVFAELMRVHGHVFGTIGSEGELLVGEGGTVEGEVVVGKLVVAGTVRGTVRARESMVVHETGKVYAEVFASTLVVAKGGVLEGLVHMAQPEAAEEAPLTA
jgi:cytoskeletal protein CcmA (bactofilin family)